MKSQLKNTDWYQMTWSSSSSFFSVTVSFSSCLYFIFNFLWFLLFFFIYTYLHRIHFSLFLSLLDFSSFSIHTQQKRGKIRINIGGGSGWWQPKTKQERKRRKRPSAFRRRLLAAIGWCDPCVSLLWWRLLRTREGWWLLMEAGFPHAR